MKCTGFSSGCLCLQCQLRHSFLKIAKLEGIVQKMTVVLNHVDLCGDSLKATCCTSIVRDVLAIVDDEEK